MLGSCRSYKLGNEELVRDANIVNVACALLASGDLQETKLNSLASKEMGVLQRAAIPMCFIKFL